MHFIGLLSDGGVHSRYDQLLACLKGVHPPHLKAAAAQRSAHGPADAPFSSSRVGGRTW